MHAAADAAAMDGARGGWQGINRWLYRSAQHLLALGPRLAPAARSAPTRTAAQGAADLRAASGEAVVVVAAGRLGDALLAAGWTRHYRAWLGRPVVWVGRPETAAVVAPWVSAFVPWDGHPAGAQAAWHTVAESAPEPFAALGDLHLCHDRRLTEWFAAVPARHRIAYDGWIDRDLQAPVRPWPGDARVVPSLAKSGPAQAATHHVLRDLAHYHAALADALGLPPLTAAQPWFASALRAREVQARLGVPADFVALHADSSQPKKDWPRSRWRELVALWPQTTFALLGSAQHAATPADWPGHVHDLRGRTTVAEALALASTARAFVGVDSGLAHAAALADVPTVVVLAQATHGYFFPYPAGLRPRLATVTAPAYDDCRGCGGLCQHAPIWRTHRRGYPCLQGVAVSSVAAALRTALAPAGTALTPERTGTAAPAATCAGR